MRSSFRRWVVGVAAAATMGIAYQTACMSFGGDQLLSTIDFCFVFDCQNGILGGVIDPCAGNSTTTTTTTNDNTTITTVDNLFIDCPTPTTDQ
jgi:hypothetical protein